MPDRPASDSNVVESLRAAFTGDVAILMGAQIISITGTVTLVTLGGILGAQLAAHPALATLPMSLMIVGTAVSTVPATMTMSRIGRRAGFLIGSAFAVLAAAVALTAVISGSFVLLCAAGFAMGAKLAFSAQYRFAAAEGVPKGVSGIAISMVLSGSLLGALLGPTFALGAGDWIEGHPHAGTFIFLALLYGVEIALLSRLAHGGRATETGGTVARPLTQVLRSGALRVAIAGGVVGQATMTFIMTATPLSMHVIDGLTLEDTAWVIQSHVIAMYAPSLVSGFLVMRLGAARMMGLGVAAIGATIAIGFGGHELLHYWASLALLGVGWNLLFVGATTLLVEAGSGPDRFKVQAVNEFCVYGASALASLSAGTVIHYFGWETLLLATTPVLLAMLAAIVMLPRLRPAPEAP